jgi:SAM-dependent methyltransferase
MASIPILFEAAEQREPAYTNAVLSEKQIAEGKHRKWVGGHWDDQGLRQIEFLKAQGLQKEHRFLDLGCGSFRAGRHLINYLDAGAYYGIDANQSVMQAGYDIELSEEQRQKLPLTNLRATDRFGVDFGVHFDMAIAQSVYTHINLNMIRLSLYRLAKVMKVGGKFYATIFERPKGYPLDGIHKTARGQPKYHERNCYWYYRSDIKWAAQCAPWGYKYIGDWDHPANQKMIEFTRLAEPEPQKAS